MIQVYLTKQEKNRLKREARVKGLTMSTLAAHKFLNNVNTPSVIGNSPKGRSHRFGFSVKPNLKSQVEYAAFSADTTVSEYMRDIIVNS
jgi:hypothetical protein